MRRLRWALVLTASYMVAEAVGGWYANSLALLADAGHMLTDAGALALALAAIWFASKPANPQKTYGYYRLEILAAFVNGIALALIAASIVLEAVERWNSATQVDGTTMTLIAAGGLTVNLICAFLLSKSHEHDLNMRSAWLHVMSDALGSVAAIIAGIAVIMYGWAWADAVTSVLISLIIVYNAWGIISESVHVLLEGTPAHINMTALREAIMTTRGVTEVHDLHVWSISSGLVAVSAHVRHDVASNGNEVLRALRVELHDRFGIDHVTIQIETEDFSDEMAHMCGQCGDSTVSDATPRRAS